MRLIPSSFVSPTFGNAITSPEVSRYIQIDATKTVRRYSFPRDLLMQLGYSATFYLGERQKARRI